MFAVKLPLLCVLLIVNNFLISKGMLDMEQPPPTVFHNGPGKCSSNVIKCKEIQKIDVCIHLCLYAFEGYLMLDWAISACMYSYVTKIFIKTSTKKY